MKWTPLHLCKPKFCLSVCLCVCFICLSVCPSFSGTLPPSSPRVPKSPTTFFRRDQKWSGPPCIYVNQCCVCLFVCLFHLSACLSICLSIFLWNTPKFLTQSPEEPNNFLLPGSEMKFTPLHLGKNKNLTCSQKLGAPYWMIKYKYVSLKRPKFN